MIPKIVSIYSGGGGLDLGFESAGFKTVFATDIWDKACETLKRNFPSTEIVCDSVENINFNDIAARHGVIDGLIGGPPCPPFSKSRFYRTEKPRGIDDENGFITISAYFQALSILRPKFFLFENVHGFVYKPHQASLDYLLDQSKRLGYKVFWQVVNCADYGVPQTRERFVCIGVRLELADFIFPGTTNTKPCGSVETGKKPWITAGEVLSDIDFELPEDKNLQAGSKHKNLLRLVPPGDNYLFFTKERGHPEPIFKWRSRYWSFLLKLSPDRASWTIQASQSNNMGPFHWRNRFLRIQEIKRLQSFPDDYEFEGSYKEQWRQIGNAVPPLLASTFAKAIQAQLF